MASTTQSGNLVWWAVTGSNPAGYVSGIVTAFKGGHTFFKITTPTHPRTSKKHGNRKAGGCGEKSHSKRLVENANRTKSLAMNLR
jgi:hypothetical protein